MPLFDIYNKGNAIAQYPNAGTMDRGKGVNYSFHRLLI